MSLLSSLRRTATLGVVFLSMSVAHRASADSFVVTSTADSDGNSCGTTCTLRQAINAAIAASIAAPNDREDIVFDETVFATKQTIDITGYNNSGAPNVGLPWIEGNINIIGPSKEDSGVTIRGATPHNYNVFQTRGNNMSISNLTITGWGIGLFNRSPHLTLTDCTFENNDIGVKTSNTQWLRLKREYEAVQNQAHPGFVPAFVTNAAVTLNNCTFSDNGQMGIEHISGATMVNSCTITGSDKGIRALIGDLTLSNSLIVGNKTANLYSYDTPDGRVIKYGDQEGVACSFTKVGNNITTGTAAEAGLDPNGLQDNGGATRTIALMKNSPAVDKGATDLASDQRGQLRAQAGVADIGAFEYVDAPTTEQNSGQP
ncbi:CSLREA domain-containing protein [bacterium]|nr:MAG: CSLREA domain-containing protein [bacterium]